MPWRFFVSGPDIKHLWPVKTHANPQGFLLA